MNRSAATLLAITLLSSAASARAEPEAEIAFAKAGFSALFTVPRPDMDIAASRGLFSSAESFADFVEANYANPFVGLATNQDLGVSFTFSERPASFKVGSDQMGVVQVGFYARQQVVIKGSETSNCFAVYAEVVPPHVRDGVSGYAFQKLSSVIAPFAECDVAE